MYALCVSGAVNTQGFVWKFFMRYLYIFIHSFIHVLAANFCVLRTHENEVNFSFYIAFTKRALTMKRCSILTIA